MKKYFIYFLWVLCYGSVEGQNMDILNQHQISVDLGSYRNRYLYPMTDIKYSSPLLQKIPIRFSTRLRSYGTWFFISKSAYDFTPVAEYYFSKTVKTVYFSAGVGWDARLRLLNDIRSEASSSAEPFVSLSIHGNHKKIFFDLPLWSRFYTNGISFTVLPEIAYETGKKLQVFARYELSYLRVYKVQTKEWRQDCFVGVNWIL